MHASPLRLPCLFLLLIGVYVAAGKRNGPDDSDGDDEPDDIHDISVHLDALPGPESDVGDEERLPGRPAELVTNSEAGQTLTRFTRRGAIQDKGFGASKSKNAKHAQSLTMPSLKVEDAADEEWQIVTANHRTDTPIRVTAVSWNAGNTKVHGRIEAWSVFLKEVIAKVPRGTDILVIGLQELAGQKEYASFFAHLQTLIAYKHARKLLWHHKTTTLCRNKFWTAVFAVVLTKDWTIDGISQKRPRSPKLTCQSKSGWGCNTQSKTRECGKAENFLFLTAFRNENSARIRINLINAHLSFKSKPPERISRINTAMLLSQLQRPADLIVFVADFNSRFVFKVQEQMVLKDGKALWKESAADILSRFPRGLASLYDDRVYAPDARADELVYSQRNQGSHMTWYEPEPPRFLPTYKLDSDRNYVEDGNAKHRPAYTDRVLLWKGQGFSTRTVAYEALPLGPRFGSDHDAVLATVDVYR